MEKKRTMRDALSAILMSEPAKPDPHGSRRIALQLNNMRRRLRGRRKRIIERGVAPKLSDIGKSNRKFVEARRKRRERAATSA